MKRGYLSEYFNGVAAKILSAVESDTLTSNQHEFNGVEPLRQILGEPTGRVRYNASFIYLTDHDDDPIIDTGFLTWYDARERARVERNVMRWEYRLYFPTNRVSQCANSGDLLVIAVRPDNSLLAIVAEAGTTIARQILWLFGLSELSHPGFSIREELDTEQDRIEFASRFILENIGVIVESSEETFLDEMLKRFDSGFPSTKDFSAYARSTLIELDSRDDPDATLLAWMEREEILFRTLEKHLIGDRLSEGFNNDVDSFLRFSLSVQNRRKSRAGHALENHLMSVFDSHRVRYSRGHITENKAKPDFLFPGGAEYHDLGFPTERLTMLGSKSSLKDRWRQVLSEADRIAQKHLLTLEAAISESQTDEMASKQLSLVIPTPLHESFTERQKSSLLNVRQFIEYVRSRQ